MNNENRKKNEDGVWEISVTELQESLSSFHLIDVRQKEEFSGELGHIAGAELCTLQTHLPQRIKELSKEGAYVFICRSGKRSSRAAQMAMTQGIQNVYNMVGGMLEWNRKNLPTEF